MATLANFIWRRNGRELQNTVVAVGNNAKPHSTTKRDFDVCGKLKGTL
jgi:hypothetical protein